MIAPAPFEPFVRIEARMRAQRLAEVIPLDAATRAQPAGAARRLGVTVPREIADG